MSKMKLLEPLLLLAAGLLAAPACSLPGPPGSGGDGSVGTQTCTEDDGGVPDGGGSTVIATGDVENEITPVSCAGTGANPNAIDKYTQGYSFADPMITSQVEATMKSITVADEAIQMVGMPYGGSGSTQFNNIERSQDNLCLARAEVV